MTRLVAVLLLAVAITAVSANSFIKDEEFATSEGKCMQMLAAAAPKVKIFLFLSSRACRGYGAGHKGNQGELQD